MILRPVQITKNKGRLKMTKELHDTLLFIDNKIKGSQTKSVFIPMEEFFWYGERNGQLTSLYEMGYITKPLFYDNGVQIQLTVKGREFINTNIEELQMKPTVFISYNWDSSDLANEIENKIKPYADVKRDKTKIKPWGNITEFMKSIRKQDFAVLIITDKYLKSPACMYEVLQLMKDDSWIDRSMFVVNSDTKVYDTIEQLNYISFWEEKYNKLDEALSSHSRATTLPQAEELKKYEYIKHNISEFMSKVACVLNPEIDHAINAIVSRLIESSIEINDVQYNEFDNNSVIVKQPDTNINESHLTTKKTSTILKLNIKKLDVAQQFTEHFSENYISLVITLENKGNTPIVLSRFGRTDKIHRNVIIIDINKYLVTPEDFITVNPNDVKIIEYKNVFNGNVSALAIQEWKKSEAYKVLSNSTFYAQDTTGKMYPENISKKLKKEWKE